MPFPLARIGLPLFSMLLAIACSSGTTSMPDGGGGSDGGSAVTPAVARITLDARIVKGAHTAAECPIDGNALRIGTFNPQKPVENGKSSGTGQLSLACKVAPSGPGFEVSVQADLPGDAQGGMFKLTASPSSTGATSNARLGIEVGKLPFAPSVCTFDANAATGQGIAAGRYWAGFKCANVVQTLEMTTCDIEGELRIENCARE